MVQNANPMFASSITDRFLLHYGLNPLVGYHLSTAYVPLAENSPLNGLKQEESKMHKASKAAFIQFSEWFASFRKYAGQSLILLVGMH